MTKQIYFNTFTIKTFFFIIIDKKNIYIARNQKGTCENDCEISYIHELVNISSLDNIMIHTLFSEHNFGMCYVF